MGGQKRKRRDQINQISPRFMLETIQQFFFKKKPLKNYTHHQAGLRLLLCQTTQLALALSTTAAFRKLWDDSPTASRPGAGARDGVRPPKGRTGCKGCPCKKEKESSHSPLPRTDWLPISALLAPSWCPAGSLQKSTQKKQLSWVQLSSRTSLGEEKCSTLVS